MAAPSRQDVETMIQDALTAFEQRVGLHMQQLAAVQVTVEQARAGIEQVVNITKAEFGAYAVATVWGRLQRSADEVLSMRDLAQLQATERAESEQAEGVEGSAAPARRRRGKHGKHASGGGGGGGGRATPEVGA